jgi:type VI protein secretion system component Hcp
VAVECAGGDGTLDILNTSQQVVVSIKLHNVQITSYQLGSVDSTEEVSLSFQALTETAPIAYPLATVYGRLMPRQGIADSDVYSVSWGLTAPPTGAPMPAKLVILKPLDTASRAMFNAALLGTNLRDVELSLFNPGDPTHPYLIYRMEDAILSPFTQSGDPHKLIDELQLTFRRLTTTTMFGGPPIQTCWDFSVNRAC